MLPQQSYRQIEKKVKGDDGPIKRRELHEPWIVPNLSLAEEGIEGLHGKMGEVFGVPGDYDQTVDSGGGGNHGVHR